MVGDLHVTNLDLLLLLRSLRLRLLILNFIKVFVFVADLHGRSQDLVDSWDSRCLDRFLDQYV